MKASRALSLLAVATLTAAACAPAAQGPAGGQPGPASPSPERAVSGQFTLYTSVPQNIASRIEQSLAKRHPDLKVTIFRAGTGEVVAKLAAEHRAGAIQADVVWVAEPSTYEELKRQDLLLKFTPREADRLAAELKDPEGFYYAGRLINTVIIYNTNLVRTPPQGWKDLLRPEFKDKVGLPTPAASGAAVAFVGALSKSPDFGYDYFRQLRANGAVQVRNNTEANQKVARGEHMAAATLDFMVRELKATGSPVDMVWPREGAIFTPSPVGIIRTSKNQEAAKAFVDYILSQQGQRDMVEVGSFLPVRDDVAPPAGAPKLSEVKRFSLDWKDITARTEEIKAQFTTIFGR